MVPPGKKKSILKKPSVPPQAEVPRSVSPEAVGLGVTKVELLRRESIERRTSIERSSSVSDRHLSNRLVFPRVEISDVKWKLLVHKPAETETESSSKERT